MEGLAVTPRGGHMTSPRGVECNFYLTLFFPTLPPRGMKNIGECMLLVSEEDRELFVTCIHTGGLMTNAEDQRSNRFGSNVTMSQSSLLNLEDG